MKDEAISVSEFNSVINQTLSFAYPEVVIEGEVSSYKISQGKWVFFDLKDADSVVNCFIPIYQLNAELEDGMLIRVKAMPKLRADGRFSLTIRAVELAGEGSVKRAFEILKAKFEKEGLFAPERKRPLPEFPLRVALITSKQAAAYNDFLTIINDRWSGLEIDHLQVQVQGIAAPGQIVETIDYLNSMDQSYDVLVIIRGGGSAEDLQAFNTEEVVRAVFGSVIPTVVAIGHEDDVALAELVADMRAATPSDAARRLVPDKTEILARVRATTSLMLNLLETVASDSQIKLDRFYHSIEMTVGSLRHACTERYTKSYLAIESLIVYSTSTLASYKKLLITLNPRAILSRGYCIARVKGKVLKSAQDFNAKDTVVLQLHHGEISLAHPARNNGGNNENQQTAISF
ncbi:exodeoxyribonuclease VII large subunit [Candidatus Saccharibacteria bacterium]|nr:exodeoxyribonuclease VII large subunit [Candidatus Saccharibacteria bacterium]